MRKALTFHTLFDFDMSTWFQHVKNNTSEYIINPIRGKIKRNIMY